MPLLAVVCLGGFVSYLVVDRFYLHRKIRRVPLRIAVTGTRGKSSVVRLLAAAMRESGYTVLAKTTGSRPVVIYPDGSEREIRRRGPASILEGKHLLELAADCKARALVAEIMSIHPESTFVESTKILRPQVLVITNVRVDHVAQMGSTRESVARCLATAISDDMTVLVLEEECFPDFETLTKKHGSKLIRVSSGLDGGRKHPPSLQLEENWRLVLAVTHHLGIEGETAIRGMIKAEPDVGALRLWSMDMGSPQDRWQVVSLFAANDPDSTRRSLDYLRATGAVSTKPLIGLISLRRDRGDRTLQWVAAVKNKMFPELARLFVIGDHAPVVVSKLRDADVSTRALKDDSPERIMEAISREVSSSVILVGMGNMGGPGKELVSYWSRRGEPL